MILRLADDTQLIAEDGILRAAEVAHVLDAATLMGEVRERAETLISRAEEEAQAVLDAAQAQAEQLRAEAHAEHARVLEEAQAQAAELTAQAQTAGEGAREEGFARGEREAAERWHDAHAQLVESQATRQQGLENELAEVVVRAVRRIVDAEPREGLFARALQTVQRELNPGAATLRVAAAEAESARSAIAAWTEGAARGWQIEVCGDETIALGSAIFTSEIGMLDASLAAQLAALQAAMDRAMQKANATTESEPVEAPENEAARDEAHV